MSTRTIELSQGYVATVDAEDYDRLMEGPKWFVHVMPGRTYAIRHTRRADGSDATEYMHRVLVPGAERVDHIDHDGLNNTRTNLRAASHAENAWNQRLRSNNTSGFKGVHWHKRTGKWMARIRTGEGRRIYIGRYLTAYGAAVAYDAAARELHGEYACFNFPRPGEQGARLDTAALPAAA